MDLLVAVKTVLSQYAQFGGRASRPEFWYWVLGVFIMSLALAIVEGAILAPALGFELFSPDLGQPLRLLMSLAIMLPSLAVAVRRLHDTGRSGWWLLLSFVPLIGVLVLLWWYAQPGLPETNEYG